MSSCSCDYDPCDFLCKTMRRARKAHKCEECRETISPGDTYAHTAYKFDGDMDTYKTCSFCDRVATDLWRMGFCFAAGELWEFVREMEREAA